MNALSTFNLLFLNFIFSLYDVQQIYRIKSGPLLTYTIHDYCPWCNLFQYRSFDNKTCGCRKCGIPGTELYRTCDNGYYPLQVCTGNEKMDISTPSCVNFDCSRFSIEWGNFITTSGFADGSCVHQTTGVNIDGSFHLNSLVFLLAAPEKFFLYSLRVVLSSGSPNYVFDSQSLRRVIYLSQPLPPPDGIFFLSQKASNITVVVFYLAGRRDLIIEVNEKWNIGNFDKMFRNEFGDIISRVEILEETTPSPTPPQTPTPSPLPPPSSPAPTPIPVTTPPYSSEASMSSKFIILSIPVAASLLFYFQLNM